MPLKTQLDEQPTLNLTPMLDIVFNLIIFFMVGTRFASVEQQIDVQVPQVSDAGKQRAVPAKRVVQVRRDGTILLDNESVTLDRLTERLRESRHAARDLSVVVRGDGEGAFQHVAGVLAACRKAGVVDLGISVRIGSATSRTAAGQERGVAR
ncbi:MAG: biopolymer transporter ExbD [Pirellulales bacterium]